MILKILLEKTTDNFIFHNTEFDTSIPIDTDFMVTFEQTVYDFVANNNLSLLGLYADQVGMYSVTIDVNFHYIWHPDTRSISLGDIKTNVVFLDRIDS